MNPRTILVPLAEQATAEVALRMAFHLARPWHAQVTALSVRTDPRDVVFLVGEAPSGQLIEQVVRAAEAEAARRLERDKSLFERMAQAARGADAGGAKLEARLEDVVGADAEQVAALGRTADLIVAARPQEPIGSREAVMLEAALFGTGRPVLVPPVDFAPAVAERIVILWNDSREAASAVAAAGPFLTRAEAVRILITEADGTRPSADRLVANLLRHGIAAEVHAVKGDAAGALADKAESLGASLIVMGAYGHSRLRELVLGGVTRHMLAARGPALLMAH